VPELRQEFNVYGYEMWAAANSVQEFNVPVGWRSHFTPKEVRDSGRPMTTNMKPLCGCADLRAS